MEKKYIKDCEYNKDFLQISLGSAGEYDINAQENLVRGKTCCATRKKKDAKIIGAKEIEEIRLNLDGSAKSQLTPKYIKSQDTSEWSKMRETLTGYYGKYEVLKHLDKEDEPKIIAMADKLANQLIVDFARMNDPDYKVSSAGLCAPRTSSTFNRKEYSIRFGNLVAFKIYLYSGKVKEELHAIKHYTKLVSTLSKKYIDNYVKDYINNNKYQLLRLLEHDKRNWEELKKRHFGDVITEPKAMPVEVSEYEELSDFFDYLKSDGPVIENSVVDSEPCMKFNRGALYTDKRMDLCKQVVGPTHIGALMESLIPNNQVEHFLLGNNIIGREGGNQVGKYLEQKHNMKTWYLAGNDLDEEAIKPVVNGLLNDTTCTQLWLKRNSLKVNGIKEIARLMRVNKTIQVLDLHNTAVFDEGVEYLMDALKENRTLDYLYLDANGLTEASAKPIVDYFKYLKENNLKGVTSIWLDMNKLFDDAIIEIVKELKDYTYLERFCIGSNGLSDKCIDQIVESFTNHPNLIVLDIAMYKATSDLGVVTNNIGDLGVEKLKPLIENNNKLQFLTVMMNGISKEGINKMAESIVKNNSLIYFEYTQYNIEVSKKTSQAIRYKLLENRKNYEERCGKEVPTLRVLKHGRDIHFIDSIYRNNDK